MHFQGFLRYAWFHRALMSRDGVTRSSKPAAQRRAPARAPGASVTRILIADDHEVVRSGLRSILEAHEGWEVVAEACDGKDAIAKTIETKPDVAIIDYSLPIMNGVEATRQIRARVPTVE